MEDNEFNIICGIILVIICIVGSSEIYERNKIEGVINLDNLTFNETKLNELKYNINVDCKELLNPESTTSFVSDIIVNQSKMSEICGGIFPELIKEEIEKVTWTCSLNWTCSDGYTWVDEDYLEEQGWEGSQLDYPPQQTALSHWAWSLPMQFEIDSTGTFRECTAEVIDCYELNSKGQTVN